MVKAMPVSLSRIEREYVIRSLEDKPSPLSILAGNTLIHVPESSYAIGAERISVTGLSPGTFENPHIRVFFRHRQRGLFFNAKMEQLADGNVSFGISGELFKEDLGTAGTGVPRITVFFEAHSFEAAGSPAWPLDCVMVNPSVSLERSETIAKLAARAGIPGENPLLSCRLFDYLDSFRSQVPPDSLASRTNEFVYIDHAHALMSLRNAGRVPFRTGQKLSVQIVYESRTIRCSAVLRGTIPVHAGVEVLCLSIETAQEEDKRFLFEKLHKFKYRP